MTSVPPPGMTAIHLVNSDGGHSMVTVPSNTLAWQQPGDTVRMLRVLMQKANKRETA